MTESEEASNLEKTATVFLWSINLDAVEVQVNEFASCLAADERERAARFRFEKDRLRFMVGRGFLRNVLARYLKRPPDEVRFHEQPNGKPGIANPNDNSNWQFNYSRSGDLAVCGIVQGRRIGVDIERHREIPDMESVARSILDERDRETWNAVPNTGRIESFYRIWTRKEARVKADGSGISAGVRQIHVPAEPFCVGQGRMIDEGESLQIVRWCLSDWNVARDTSASVAVETRSQQTTVRYSDNVGSVSEGRDPQDPSVSLLSSARLIERRFSFAADGCRETSP